MKKLLLQVILVLSFLSAACASKYMQPAEDKPQPLGGNTATITFFRSSIFGGNIQAPIAEEIAPDRLEFVAISSMDTKCRKIVPAGEHTYVVGGESGFLLKANLAPKKHYYVRVEPRLGFFKARFKLVPLTPQQVLSPDVQKQLRECTLVEPSPISREWFRNNMGSMMSKLRSARQDFDARTDRSENLLPESYGLDSLY